MGTKTNIIREFGKLWKQTETDASESINSFNQLYLNDHDFDNLQNFIEENRDTDIERAFQIGRNKGRSYIRVKNYVGVLETKNKTVIEVLPKIYGLSTSTQNDLSLNKRIFLKMLRCLRDSPFISIKDAHLKTLRFTILEVFITVFLSELQRLLKIGLRKNYIVQADNQSFLKGKLLFHEQQKKNLLRPYKFFAEYDEFVLNTPPNRLIKSCLKLLLSHSKSINNQKQIRHQLIQFDSVPNSKNLTQDLQKSKTGNRLHQHYENILNWVRVFLMGQSFTNFKGKSLNQALLFPMERIFEDYIGVQIKKHIKGYNIKLQDKRFHLINEHLGAPKFRLKPDIVLSNEKSIIIIDTKWKVINENRPRANYEISQSDMYQLFGYGEKYKQSGKLVTLILLYPMQEQFINSLPKFNYYSESLPLYVIPFNLANQDIEAELKKLFGVT